jgi:hypothetical protein
MANRSPAPPRADPMPQTSASGNGGVYSQPAATDTFQRTTKSRIGVYDRPARTFGSWSPMLIIALMLGVLFLLWMLGIFKYILG